MTIILIILSQHFESTKSGKGLTKTQISAFNKQNSLMSIPAR